MSRLSNRNKMTGKGRGGENGRGDNKGMEDFGVGGIWSGGGRWDAEFLKKVPYDLFQNLRF